MSSPGAVVAAGGVGERLASAVWAAYRHRAQEQGRWGEHM